LGDNFPAQGNKGCALFLCERGAKIGFMFGGYSGQFFQQLRRVLSSSED
jgi:hypothetical protein